MKSIYPVAIAVILLPLLVVAVSCTSSWSYDIDTVRFVQSDPQPKNDQPVPSLWIDTHVEISGMFGGTIKSHAPFDAALSYTDNDRAYTGIECTSITITYDDDSTEQATGKLKLPIRIDAQEHESINSMDGGEIKKTKLMLISGKLPGVITREKPFTLKLKGHFQKQDGTEVPFEIDEHYDVEQESGTRSWSEVMENA